MKLISLRVTGIGRFEHLAEMRIAHKVIAIVGPNEAGKTSFLKAIGHLTDGTPFSPIELTRRTAIAQDVTIVSARFLLEDADREQIGEIHGSQDAKWLEVGRRPDGTLVTNIEPHLRRDRRPRIDALDQARALRTILTERTEEEIPEYDADSVVDNVTALIDALSIDVETLTDATVELMVEIVNQLSGDDSPTVAGAATTLNRAAVFEGHTHPQELASHALQQRAPLFLLFDEEARNLASDYDLNQVIDEPPSALRNLAALAQLDLRALHTATASRDLGLAEQLEQEANRRLKEIFEVAWSQAGITVRLRSEGQILHVLVATESGGYSSIADRSDGLRAYVALLAFASAHSPNRPSILLIDEAETHLHYDAQADLVKMFENQTLVANIVYTTHSAGCLPEDLGSGVRAIVPIEGDRSTVRNWFWETGAGFSPLLMAMGASAFAFGAVRRAVIAEGASELILLPRILKDALGSATIGFQVAPGLSMVSSEAVAQLDLEAARVAYIVDGDDGGRNIRAKLLNANVDSGRICDIRTEAGQGLVLEDLLDPSLYARAIAEMLGNISSADTEALAAHLPEVNRPAYAQQWCVDRGLTTPSKRAVAMKVVDLADGLASICDEARRGLIVDLHGRLVTALQ